MSKNPLLLRATKIINIIAAINPLDIVAIPVGVSMKGFSFTSNGLDELDLTEMVAGPLGFEPRDLRLRRLACLFGLGAFILAGPRALFDMFLWVLLRVCFC